MISLLTVVACPLVPMGLDTPLVSHDCPNWMRYSADLDMYKFHIWAQVSHEAKGVRGLNRQNKYE